VRLDPVAQVKACATAGSQQADRFENSSSLGSRTKLQMDSAEQIVLVCTNEVSERFLLEVVELEGYDVKRASRASDVISAADADSVQAILVRTQKGDETETLLRQTADRMPRARYIVVLPEGSGVKDALVSRVSDPGRVLWVECEVISPEDARSIRHFLRGEGYWWASDLLPGAGRGVSLLQPTGGLRDLQEEVATKLVDFAADLSGYTELGAMLQEVLRRYMDLLSCQAGSVYVWDEQSSTLVLQAAEGPERDQRVGLRQKLGEGLAGWVAEVGECVLITDTRKVRRLRGRASRRYDDFSVLGVPVWHGEQLVAVVCLTAPKDGRPFRPEDLRVAKGLSGKLGGSIHGVGLMSELRGFSERLQDVLQSYSALAAQKDTQVEEVRALSANVLDGIPIGVIAYDENLRTVWVNAAGREMFGIEPGASLFDSPAPLEEELGMDRAEWRGKLTGVVSDGRGFRLQRVDHRSDERARILDIVCSPLHGHDGSALGGILTVRDVTEDVEMEVRLSSAERLALVGKIAAKVAHELNNPLDGILRFLSLARRTMEETPDRARSYLEESHRGLMRMSNILRQLLAFSRSYRRAGQPVSLSQVIRDSLALYEGRARETNTQVFVDVPPGLPACKNLELCEVFGNVIKNALDAMGSDGRLTVEAAHQNGEVNVLISDTGPGLPDDIKEKIFEPFFSTKKDGTGTGLGLAACRDTLARIGGEIRLCPSEQGASFRITIPVAGQTEK
jgi:signal transduction histidine kinase